MFPRAADLLKANVAEQTLCCPQLQTHPSKMCGCAGVFQFYGKNQLSLDYLSEQVVLAPRQPVGDWLRKVLSPQRQKPKLPRWA